MEKRLVIFTLTVLSLSFGRATASGITGREVVASSGQDVALSWRMPRSLTSAGLLLVSHDQPSNIVFMAASPTPSSVVITSQYRQRVTATVSFPERHVRLTLQQVGAGDAGRYLCVKGPSHLDVVGDCGATLVIADTPHNVSITSSGSPLTGSDLAIRCMATSRSLPRDHNQPMRYRWFEAMPYNAGQSSDVQWREIYAVGEKEEEEDDNVLGHRIDSGSGEAEPEALMGGNSTGTLSDVFEVVSLTRRDVGRMLACSASDGLELWSPKSRPFVLKPEWQPAPSDLTLTPARSSVTLTLGESLHVTCSSDCQPACTLLWQRVTSDDQRVTVTKGGRLSLEGVGRLEEGAYRCVAANRHGNAFTTLSLTVADPPVPWFRQTRMVLVVVAVVTVGLALGMTAVAVVVVRCRQRPAPVTWPGARRTSDAVPLSMVSNDRPSLVSYC